MKLPLCLVFVFASTLPLAAQPAGAKVSAARPLIDRRGVQALDLVIAKYKKLKSFNVVADEEISGGPKPRYASFIVSMQPPWRAKFDYYSKTGPGPVDGLKLETRRLLGASSYIEWNSGEKEPRETPLKSVAARQEILQRMLRPDALLVLGLFRLASGINPAKAPGVRQVLFSRTKGLFGPLLKVHVVCLEPDAARPLMLDYFCSEKEGLLEKFVLSRMVHKKLYVAACEVETQTGNDMGDQAGNDRYLYGWDRLPNDVDRGGETAKP